MVREDFSKEATSCLRLGNIEEKLEKWMVGYETPKDAWLSRTGSLVWERAWNIQKLR